MKAQTNEVYCPVPHAHFLKLALIVALTFSCIAFSFADDSQGNSGNLIQVAMVDLGKDDSKSQANEETYWSKQSSTYVSNLICD